MLNFILSLILSFLIISCLFYLLFKINQKLQLKFDQYLYSFTRAKNKDYIFHRNKGFWIFDMIIWFSLLSIIIYVIFITTEGIGILFSLLILTLIIIRLRFAYWRNSHIKINSKKHTMNYVNLLNRPNKKVINLQNINLVKLQYLHILIQFNDKKTLHLPIYNFRNVKQLYAVLKTYE